MEWYPNEHCLHTFFDYDANDHPVKCGQIAPPSVGTDNVLDRGQVVDIRYSYGELQLEFKVEKKNYYQNGTYTRRLILCDRCEKDLLWAKIERLESVRLSFGQ